jgi:alpha-beta hydrolase superfamily lysophospholipase
MTGARITALGTAAGAVGTLGLGAFVARRLLFPTPYTATATVRSTTDTEVELTATRDTRLPGTYDLQRDGTRVRVGAITETSTETSTDPSTGTEAGSTGDTVRRSTTGPVAAGAWAWDALRHDGPDDVPGTEPDAATTHVVHVHGQSLGPRQVLRGLGVWRSLGATSEVIDTTDLPLRSLDAGAADRIVTAVRAARARGVQRVVLQGWSAGALACSVAAARVDVDGLVGVSPLLDVDSALRGAVRAAHLPGFVGTVAGRIATTPVLSRLAGAPTPVATTAWQDSATPTLLIHSEADTLVAADDVVAVAAQQHATTVAFRTAPHTLEWNEDPERWETAVRDFAAGLPAAS